MSDLVRELRELAKVWTAAFHGRADILTEAADEIERLQAVVDAAREALHLDASLLDRMIAIRRALDGEHTDNVTPPADLLRGSDADGEP